MKLEYRNIPFRNWLILALGSIASQVILFASLIMLSRLYNPFDFGKYSYLIGIASLATPIATLRLESAIVSADSDIEALYFAKRAAISTAIVIAITLAITEIILKLDFNFIKLPSGFTRFALPMLILLYSFYSIMTQLVLRARLFSTLSLRGSIQNMAIGSTQYLSGLSRPNYFSLIMGEISGRLLGLILLIPAALNIFKHSNRGARSLPLNRMEKPNSPLRFILPATVLDTASTSIFVIAISHWFGNLASGNVAMAQRIIAVPVTILGLTLGQVLLSEYSFSLRRDSVISKRKIQNIFTLLIFIGFLMFLLTFALGPILVTSILGAHWTETSKLVQLLSFSLGINLIWNPLSSLYLAYKLWKDFLVTSILRLSLILELGLIGKLEGASYQHVVLIMSLGGSLVQLLGAVHLYRRVCAVSSLG